MKLIRVTIYLISLILVAIAAYQAGYTAQKPVVIINPTPAPAAPLPGPIVPRASPSPEPVTYGRWLGSEPGARERYIAARQQHDVVVPDANNDIFVYVTEDGTHYHDAESKHAGNWRVGRMVRLGLARKMGYTACLACGG